MESIQLQVEKYLEWCEYIKRMTPDTLRTKRQALKRFLNENPNVTDFSTLTNWQFDEWRAGFARRGKSGKTINNYSDHVVSCLRWLNKKKLVPVEFNFDLVERAEEDDPEILVYTPEEIALALKHCKGPRDDLILSLAYQSGLRLSEMATLKLENIEGLAISVMGKKRKRRRTFIREDTRKKLDRWLVLAEITEGYIFPSPTIWDHHLTNQQIRDLIKATFKRTGIEKRVHPHALRHTWFTTMLDNGAPLMDTAIMGGHSDPMTTKRYYHASPQRHAAIHQQFIPSVDQLTKGLDTKEDRHQEMY